MHCCVASVFNLVLRCCIGTFKSYMVCALSVVCVPVLSEGLLSLLTLLCCVCVSVCVAVLHWALLVMAVRCVLCCVLCVFVFAEVMLRSPPVLCCVCVASCVACLVSCCGWLLAH